MAIRAADGPKNGVVLLIRHAEKPENGPGLSPEGEKRAALLPKFFREYQVNGKPLKLDLIYAAADSEQSRRPKLTVDAVSQEFKAKIIDRFETKQLEKLTDAIKDLPAGETVLVCWRHGEMEELIQELGAKPKELLADGKWPDHVYDWVIELHYDRKGRLLSATRNSQHLLPSDGY